MSVFRSFCRLFKIALVACVLLFVENTWADTTIEFDCDSGYYNSELFSQYKGYSNIPSYVVSTGGQIQHYTGCDSSVNNSCCVDYDSSDGVCATNHCNNAAVEECYESPLSIVNSGGGDPYGDIWSGACTNTEPWYADPWYFDPLCTYVDEPGDDDNGNTLYSHTICMKYDRLLLKVFTLFNLL